MTKKPINKSFRGAWDSSQAYGWGLELDNFIKSIKGEDMKESPLRVVRNRTFTGGVYELDDIHVRPATPEQALVCAIVYRAIRDLALTGFIFWGRSPTAKAVETIKIRQNARDWILSDAESQGYYTFKDCCEHLNIDHKELRERVGELLPSLYDKEVFPKRRKGRRTNAEIEADRQREIQEKIDASVATFLNG